MSRESPERLREKVLDRRYVRKASKDALQVIEDVHGIRFVLYPWDRPNLARLVRRRADESEFKAVPLLVPPGSNAIDLGANVGLYSVLLSRLCGPTGRVWSFEPVPETYERLLETLALNRCKNVTAVPIAISDESSVVKMNLFDPQFAEWNTLGNPSMPLKWGKRASPSRSVEVNSRTLDRFCDEEEIARVHFMKVDVEGFELAVFRGARKLLQEGRINHICFEISKGPLKGAGVESRAVFQGLEEHGYHAYMFNDGSRRFEGPVYDSAAQWTNFFASRQDLTRLSNEEAMSKSATVAASA
jgi:FkbM family methyltransferase